MRKVTTAGCALSLLAISAVASAQTTTSLPDVNPTNVSLRVGGVFATDGPLRNQQKLWFGIGAEYQFPRDIIKDSPTYFSLDAVAQSGAGGHGNFFPICLNQRFYFDQTGSRRAYFFFGAGVVIMNVTSSNTTGVLRTGFGYEFTQNVFVESSFVAGGQVDGFQPTSIGFYLGYRF
ncbi:MAG TPA: hypothetical protein VKT78_12930 [Fimbriimonadaceae bacterium]|nr:hypothetical protein [Fimbriimonadaceae bacterium]